MGTTTDFIGRVDITPPLNDAEQQYLTAFSASRRCQRIGGPYEVPYNPYAAEAAVGKDDGSQHEYNDPPEGQPSLWCDWTPDFAGSSLGFNGNEKFYGATQWMVYLIDHFLAPGAYAKRSQLHWFERFTFDHLLNGVVAGCNRDTRELYLIRVQDNYVRRETLVAGEPYW